MDTRQDSATEKELSREKIEAIFNEEFDEEFGAFEDNIRTVSKGNTGLANTWADYLGLGGITAGTLLTNMTFGLLAAFKIITPFVTVGTGIGVGVVGLAAGIIFRKARLKEKRERYEEAEEFLDNELYESNEELFKKTLFNNLYPALIGKGRSEINEIVKAVIEAIANLILHSKIEDFKELNEANFAEMLGQSIGLTAGFKLNTKLIMQVIHALPPAKQQQEVSNELVKCVEEVKVEANQQMENQDEFDIEAIASQLADGSEKCLEEKGVSSYSLQGVQTFFSGSGTAVNGEVEKSNDVENEVSTENNKLAIN